MTKTTLTAGALLAAAALGTGCAQLETKPASTELAPAEMPPRAPGDAITMEAQRGSRTAEVVAVGGVTVTWEDDRGCRWTELRNNPFAPPLSWENCDGSSGEQEFTRQEGRLLPLEVGSTASWSVRGQTQGGNSWSTVRRCEVTQAVNITVPAGTYDAYEVVCRDDYNTRTYYYAPEADGVVAFRRQHHRRGVEDQRELVSASWLETPEAEMRADGG